MKAPGLSCAGCSASIASMSVQELQEGLCEHFFQVEAFPFPQA